MTGDSVTLWKLLMVPFPDQSAHYQIVPEAVNIGVGLNSGRIMTFNFCQYENLTLCLAQTE